MNKRLDLSWASRMQAAIKTAHFSDAARLYDDALGTGASPNSTEILARAWLYLKKDAAATVAFLLKHRSARFDEQQLARWHMLLGVGYARMREFSQADAHFQAAANSRTRSSQLRAELEYHRARRYLIEMRLAEAWSCQASTSVDSSFTGKVRSEHLRSFILNQEERYSDEARSLIKVLGLIERRKDKVLEEWYWAVHTLAVLARELPMPEAADVAERALTAAQAWSPDFAVNHFQALKAIGWTKALQGDQLNCFRYLRKAQQVAPTAPWAAMVHLDRAYFAQSSGERQWSINEIAAAEELVESIDWDATQNEERVALLLFAELFSGTDAEKASYYIARYNALDKLRSPLLHFAFDQRLKALSDYANGVVREGKPGFDDAVNDLRAAWSTFDRIGYNWRAGRAAMHLFKMTGQSRWRRLAVEELKHYEHSWLWTDLSNMSPRGTRTRRAELTLSQERIFRMICDGLSTDAIARKLGRSKSTVRNHLKVVFKAFGVRSRPALVALAARRRLI